MSHFIRNNKSESLSAIINNLLPSKTKAIDFLVGYFYFSGMKEIYQNIEDKPMRLLVGLDMDRNSLNNTAENEYRRTDFTFYDEEKVIECVQAVIADMRQILPQL